MYTSVERNGNTDGCGDGTSHPGYGSPGPTLPAAPRPSADSGMKAITTATGDTWGGDSGSVEDLEDIDIFTMPPVVALKMLCGLVEEMVQMTGDIPPTPPVSHPTTPKELRQDSTDPSGSSGTQEDCDVPAQSKTPIGSPEAHPTEPFPVIGSNAEPLHIQHGAITRKFYSKRPPPIPLEEYLLRLHKYCPMSTAVYLATSLYIHRLAIIERILPVTGRNAHRLVLAALRVAMKALEDLSYPHRRFAKVGGITEAELGRLEISFCFLTDFELKVSKELLHKQAVMMRDTARFHGLSRSFKPSLPVARSLAMRPMMPQDTGRELSASAA
ncbi:hypothetical protein MMC30_007157 [Trapelia coarctata]|nr:hypothetical protein [Trapelia coarctata]